MKKISSNVRTSSPVTINSFVYKMNIGSVVHDWDVRRQWYRFLVAQRRLIILIIFKNNKALPKSKYVPVSRGQSVRNYVNKSTKNSSAISISSARIFLNLVSNRCLPWKHHHQWNLIMIQSYFHCTSSEMWLLPALCFWYHNIYHNIYLHWILFGCNPWHS